jgi:23S rRNA maturation mini-RNase III
MTFFLCFHNHLKQRLTTAPGLKDPALATSFEALILYLLLLAEENRL